MSKDEEPRMCDSKNAGPLPTIPPAQQDYWAQNMARAIRDWENVLHGHDAVHPDRNACGGVGGCALMALEYDSRTKVVDMLEEQVRGTGFEVRRKEPFEGQPHGGPYEHKE